ncbi:MAG: DUF2069 domain-containing protein [Betaproteobacteria bacterium]|nr:DUF2069 domain-containing protein [Betaproteobacteria bacterium]
MTAAALPRPVVVAAALLIALIALCLLWELWLAPLRPGGSWLALKVLPLLLIAPGVLGGRLYTYRLSTMLVLAYFAEGVVRGYSESGPSQWLAWAETALATAYFFAAIVAVRSLRGGIHREGRDIVR